MLTPISQYYINDSYRIKVSTYVSTVLNISDRDLMFSPNHMCLLSVNAMTLLLTYFEIRIMPKKMIKNDYARCSLPFITKHTAEA